MRFFESFNPRKKDIEEDDNIFDNAKNIGINKEPGMDELTEVLNKEYKTKEIITGNNPLEADPEDREAVENLLENRREDIETFKDNISLLMQSISHNNEKIKMLEESLRKSEEELSNNPNDSTVISRGAERLQRMIESLQKVNEENERQISEYEEKINGFYNLN